ncbi:hypothetical protein AVEN_91631-1 [Araneus ventricosus]|uniref:Uncharacterized protein n=1 Tax=Araneus ventricosus TaxID=182803 RepID=A0A4Y2EWJ3_ARAVE|nr:hypothetical protein AVEN_91631-1 [Araneus ventricosus]
MIFQLYSNAILGVDLVILNYSQMSRKSHGLESPSSNLNHTTDKAVDQKSLSMHQDCVQDGFLISKRRPSGCETYQVSNTPIYLRPYILKGRPGRNGPQVKSPTLLGFT